MIASQIKDIARMHELRTKCHTKDDKNTKKEFFEIKSM